MARAAGKDGATRRPMYAACRRAPSPRRAAAGLVVLLAAAGVPRVEGAAPGPPTGLHVPFVTRFEIAVAWTAPAGATMYRLEYRKTATAGPFISYGPGAVFDETSMRLGDLQEDTAYDLRVYAGNADGWSAAAQLLGNPNTRTTNPPEPPLNVREYAFTETSMSLTWNDAAGPAPTHWRVKVSECVKRIWQAPCVEGRPCLSDRTVRCRDYAYYKDASGAIVEFTSKPAIIANLKQGYTYFMVVEARNRNINGYDYGGSLPARLTPRGAYDSAPTNLLVNGVKRTAVILSWDAAAGATHYRAQFRVPAETAAWQPTSTQPQLLTTGTEYVVEGLTTDKTYEFRVLARDLFEETVGGGEPKWAGDAQGYEEDQHASNIVSATPVMELTQKPTGLVVTGVRDTEVHLSWNAVARANYYVIQYKPLDEAYESLQFWMDVESTTGVARRFTGTSGAVTELTTGRRYEFRIKAFNAHVAITPISASTYLGYSGPSDLVLAVPLARLAPAADFRLMSPPWLDMLDCMSKVCALRTSDQRSVQLDVGAPGQHDVLVGALLRIASGGAMHENALIVAYNGTSRNATLAAPLAKTLTVGDRYEVSRYALGYDRATITWTHIPGATKYRISIRRSGAHEAYSTRAVLTEPFELTGACVRALPNNGSSNPAMGLLATRCYEMTGLVNGVSYDVTISAGNLHLDWGLETQALQITPVSPPSESAITPRILSQTAETVLFTWSTPVVSTAPTVMYRVSHRKVTHDASAPWSPFKDYTLLTDQDAGFEVTGLERGYAYDFSILSGNLAGFRHPDLSFRLVTPCTHVRVDSVRSALDCSKTTANGQQLPGCMYMSVKLSWTPQEHGFYFKVLARQRGSTAAYVGLPAVAAAPYVSKATILGPNVTTFAFDNIHYPDIQENVEFEYKVVSSFGPNGPFEDVGSLVTVAVSRQTPSPVHTLRLKSKTSNSITVNWNHTMSNPKPYFFVARLCPAMAANCSGNTLYPNDVDQSQATRFYGSKDLGFEAMLDRFAGNHLVTDVPYNITIYACNYFDANGDGILTGDESCNPQGTKLNYSVIPGGLVPPVTGIKVTQTHENILRLEWQRPGQRGNAAIMYDIHQREMGTSEWSVASRMLVRGVFGNCVSNSQRCPRCSITGAVELDTNDKCLKAVGVMYGTSEGEDTCGMDYCVPHFGGAVLLITEGHSKGESRILRQTTSPIPPNVFILNKTLFGDVAIDAYSDEFSSATYNVYSQKQLGGLCCPISSQTVVAYIANLKADTAYQFKVYAGSMNEQNFETIGSPITTGFTVSKPNGVEDLSFLYLMGANATRVQWTDPGGPKFCGERLYQILARVKSDDPWELLNLTQPHSPWIKHTEYTNGVGKVQLTIVGLPWARTTLNGIYYPLEITSNLFMVRSYCSNHLGLTDSQIPNMTYLDDIAYSRADSNVINVTLKAPPDARIQGLQVLYVTADSAFMRWKALPRTEIYKVQVSTDSTWSAGPWISNLNGFSGWKDWPNENATQIFRTTEAKITGLTPGLRYRFKIMGGTRHGNTLGLFSAESLPTPIAYTLVRPPYSSDIELSLFEFTRTNITVRFSVGSQMSVDPANHTRNIVSLLIRKGDKDFEGGINQTGCTNVLEVDGTFIGPPPGCRAFVVLNYTAEGRTFYEYTFTNLEQGVPHQVMLKTFNLDSPNRRAIVFTGNATPCICSTYASKFECSQYRLFGSTLACEPSPDYAYMQPLASPSDNAYTNLYAFVRSGTGAGQQRRIVGYLGVSRRMQVDAPWEILLDATSLVEIHESGLASEGHLATSCSAGSTVCMQVSLGKLSSSAVTGAYINHYMELVGEVCDKQMRRVVGYDGPSRNIMVYPPFTCNPVVGTTTYKIRPFSFATRTIGPIVQRGPPMVPQMPRTGLILHNSVSLSWEPVKLCIGELGFIIDCEVELYRLRKRKTHDSSDFPVDNATFSTDYFFSPSSSTTYTGLEDMSSFEIQVSAKTAYNIQWSPWSVSQYVKLTGGPPSLQPTLLPFAPGEYNDQIRVKWTTDLNPKQMDRFYISVGKNAASIKDFKVNVNGTLQRKVFMDYDVCTVISSTKATCEAFVTGLELGTIYALKVYGGNMNGFEETGTKIGTQATLRLPVTPVLNFQMLRVLLSGNISNYGVELSWDRPNAYPPVTRYYVSASRDYGSYKELDPVIYSTQRSINHVVGFLTKGSNYRFRVHSGNDDGLKGFHLDMEDDPTTSNVINVVPDGVPGRVKVSSGTPIVPDKNSMVELNWTLPNAGADAEYYQIGTKLIYDLSGCNKCDQVTNLGFCLANSADNPILDASTNMWRYRKCDYTPPCDATCQATIGISMYKGCTPADEGCATNPNCNPQKRLCLTPCQGAHNEGAGSAGRTCEYRTTRAEIRGLIRDVWYEFYVFAGSTAGIGLPSDPFWLKTAALPVPVTDLKISTVSRNNVRLVWNVMDPSLCTGGGNGNCTYKVTWDPPTPEGSMAYTTRRVGPQRKVYYENFFDHAVDFSQGTIQYKYRVYAGDDLTNMHEQFGTPITLPAAANDFKVVSATESSLTFSWNPDPAADTYRVYMSSGQLAYRAASSETQETFIRVEGLAKGLPYNFKVFSKTQGRTPFEYSGSNVYRAMPAGLSAAPKDLQVVATSRSTVLLTWQAGDAEPPVRYKILRSVDGSSDFAYPQDIEMLRGSPNSVLLTDLSDSSEYAFKIFAGNFNGFEEGGSEVIEKIQPVGRVRELSIRGVSDSSVTIDWLPPEYGRTPSHYQLQYTLGDTQTKIADVQHLGGNRATQSALLTPLVKREYKLRVFARARSGYYEPAGTGDLSAVPLLVPYGLKVIFTGVDYVTLAWKMPPNLGSGFEPQSFKIDYVMTSDGTTGKVQNIPVYQNLTTITGLKTNRPYSFSIKAEYQSGLFFGTLRSNEVEATPLDQPFNLTITAVGATMVSLEWISPATGILPIAYRIRYIETVSGLSSDVNEVPHAGSFLTKQKYTVTGLTNGLQYGFIVLAQAGTGAYSDNEITPIKTTPLSLPNNVRITSITQTSARVEWTPPKAKPGAVNPSNYELHYSNQVQILPFGSSAWVVQHLTGGLDYSFCLFVRSPAGDLIPADGGCIAATTVNQVTNLRTIDSTNTSVTLQWDAVKPVSAPVSYRIVASPITREISAVTGTVAWVPAKGKKSLSLSVAHVGDVAHNATLTNLSYADIFSFQVHVVVRAIYVEPVGSNSIQGSPVGRVTRSRLCYYDKTEISVQWNAPITGPTPSRYQISYRPYGCTAASWQVCPSTVFSPSVTHQGAPSRSQAFTVFGLSQGAIYEVRVHAYNDLTGLFDPNGGDPVVMEARGDRSDFAVDLPRGAKGFVEVSKSANVVARRHFETKSITLEAWIKLDPTGASTLGFQGIAGNLYSYTQQSADSRGAGHFGYGLICETKFEDQQTYCGIQIGTLNDPKISLLGLCPQLSFENSLFCGAVPPNPGWTTPHRAESSKPIPRGVWTHIAGSYNHSTGALRVTVNGELQGNKTVSWTDFDGSMKSLEIYYSGNDGAYPQQITMPRHRMGWHIGRLLVGVVAPTVATAPYAYFSGTLDDVRVWSYAKSAVEMRDTGFLDTVSPSSPGLLGYWPFDEPSFGRKCADEIRVVRDASSDARHAGTLYGPALLILSSAPSDKTPVFSADTPSNNTEFVVHLGDSIHLRAAAIDPNPTDETSVVLQVPGRHYNHPTGATFSQVSELGAEFTWSPLPRDAGKLVTLCFVLSNVVTNQLRPDFALTQMSKMRRCMHIRVPLCVYKARQGDTMRSVARKFNTNWRTLFLLNPEIGHPNQVAAGLLIRIGSIYKMRPQDNVTALAQNTRTTWSSLANNNAAIVNRLWTDEYFKAAGSWSSSTSVIEKFDPGEGVFDILYEDLAMQHNYTGAELCLVAQLNVNCI
jgi:hypothetical protein